MALNSGAGAARRKPRKVRSGSSVPEEAPAAGPTLHTAELARMPPREMEKVAAGLDIPSPDDLNRQDLLYRILGAHTTAGGRVVAQGTFHQLVEGFGFLRSPINSYLPGPNDVYVSPAQIRRYQLRNGDMLRGEIRRPRGGERYFGLLDLQEVNGLPAEEDPERLEFDKLTALHPDRMLRLENDSGDLSARVVDLVAPIGAGQRGMIVSPPRAGKTVLLQSIAGALRRNHPDVELLILLVDERPEEVTEMVRSVDAEVLSSTFDERGIRHIQVAEAALDRARRRVELGKDVVILLDSLTRLARAYNHAKGSSRGRLLSGGMDASAIQYPKRFFGAARNTEEAGSLTILATALVDTGSRLDDLVYEEFKGTGNMEIHLDQRLLEHRLFPAIDLNRSSTRREELLLKPEELHRMGVLRRFLAPMDPVEAMALVLEKIRATRTNRDFLHSMVQGR